MRGPVNQRCMVINQKTVEKEMGNRGSKSVTFLLNNLTVKEQRVNGNLCGVYTLRLRYTLMGFERNYQVSSLSKQIHKYPRAL